MGRLLEYCGRVERAETITPGPRQWTCCTETGGAPAQISHVHLTVGCKLILRVRLETGEKCEGSEVVPDWQCWLVGK